MSGSAGERGAAGAGGGAPLDARSSAAAQPSATAWLARLHAREICSRELVEATLSRIDTADARVYAVVARDDAAALAAADAADAERARRVREREPLPPLLGLPLTIKDALDAAGLPTCAGTLARAGAPPAARDATAVARVRAAGAIPLLKTNVPELCSSFETDNLVHGLTRNPLDPARTPGGSSGGEAALLGADASIAGLGTDGGGSIRVPSHYCGTVGLRPTTGRTPETGIWPPTRAAGTLDFTCVGPMARHVEDLGLLLAVIAGADGVDPYAVDVPLRDWREVDPATLRVAFYADHPCVPATTRGTQAAVHAAAAFFDRLGCRVERIGPPVSAAPRSATELFFALAGADGGAGMRAATAEAGGRHHPQFAALLDGAGDPLDAGAYLAIVAEAHAYRAAVRAAFRAAAYDVVLSPVAAGPAPLHGVPPAGIEQDRYLRYEAFEYAHVNAVAGLPVVSVPVAVEGGMPVGVQVAAPAFREDLALAAAAVLEAEYGGFAINRSLADRSPS
ncbi:amidase [Conexibacter woesei]|uniref:Amidase n=1 Tax=Conexibacter woesei (strain DSM 14684 / CCUG 47730 / CIP 108061 / JCM 11494 / NBRC 100937 / ID131577) TaxID=469383 RepID=D3F2N1_CONWI|nr:amidase [Conexibacter woesei]ADB52297.1 Amidase [Conexibacter woesei DSM 14684]